MTTKKAAKKKASKKKAAKKKAAKKTTGRKSRANVDWSGIPLSVTQFAQLLNVNPGRISEYIKKGMPANAPHVSGSHTNIYLDKALPWVIQRIRRGTEAEGPQERLWDAKADHQELINANERKDLIYVHHVAVAFSNAVTALKTTSTAFVSRVSNTVATMDNPAQVREYLLTEVRSFWLDFRAELERLADMGVKLSSHADDD